MTRKAFPLYTSEKLNEETWDPTASVPVRNQSSLQAEARLLESSSHSLCLGMHPGPHKGCHLLGFVRSTQSKYFQYLNAKESWERSSD